MGSVYAFCVPATHNVIKKVGVSAMGRELRSTVKIAKHLICVWAFSTAIP